MILNEHNPFLAAVPIQWTWLGIVHQHQVFHISQPQIENSQKFCWLLLQLPKPSFIPQITSCARKFMANFFPKQIASYLMRISSMNILHWRMPNAFLKRCRFCCCCCCWKTTTGKTRRRNKERPTSNLVYESLTQNPLNWHVLIFHCIWLCVFVSLHLETMPFAGGVSFLSYFLRKLKMSTVI